MTQEKKILTHNFEPIYNKDSRILILGSFPSVKSRENNFYYGHPQNRFWRVIAGVTGNPVPVSIDEKKELLLSNHIAIWDVIASCSIQGSSDSSIRDVVVNDFTKVLADSSIQTIYVNGNDDRIVLTSVFDNLGKGASSAAVENMNIAMGFEETTAL